MSLLSRYRFFASTSRPYISGLNNTQATHIQFSGSRLSFNCPRSSGWQQSDNDVLEAEVDITGCNSSTWEGPPLPYFQSGYAYRTIFARNWTLWGPIWQKSYVGATSLFIRLYHIPRKSPNDSLFDADYYQNVLKTLAEHSGGRQIKWNRCGPLGTGIGLDHWGYRVEQDCERKYNQLITTPIACEYLLVWDFFFVRAPQYSHTVLDAGYTLANEIINSIDYTFSEHMWQMRTNVLKRYAECADDEYDEALDCIRVELDLDLDDDPNVSDV